MANWRSRKPGRHANSPAGRMPVTLTHSPSPMPRLEILSKQFGGRERRSRIHPTRRKVKTREKTSRCTARSNHSGNDEIERSTPNPHKALKVKRKYFSQPRGAAFFFRPRRMHE